MSFLIDDSKPLVTALFSCVGEKKNDQQFTLLQNNINNETFRYKEV